MGYPELRLALREETQRQLQAIEVEARSRAAELIAAARVDVDRERAAALAQAERDAAAADRRAEGRQRLETEGLILVEARRLLAELRDEAAARLPALVDDAMRARLGAELAEAQDGAGWALQGGGLVAVRGGRTLDNSPGSRLLRAWPGLEPELAALLFGGGR